MAAALKETGDAAVAYRCLRDAFVARQPIFDRNLAVVAYELLYRRGDSNVAEVTDGSQATSQLVVSAFMDFELDTLTADQPAYINITGELLVAGHVRGLPRDRVVLEVLETVAPDDAAILEELRALRRDGFVIALDDFVLGGGRRRLLEVADVVKLDVRALNRQELVAHVEALRDYPVRLLAEKVESHQAFAFCKALGFDYFQGYFFVRPETLERRRVPTNRVSAMQLLSRLNDPACSIMELTELVRADVALSYRVLQYVNSPFCGTRREITSVGHAVALLGLRQLRQLVTLLVLSGIDDKPGALVALALVRARMAERMAEQRGLVDPGRFFTVGLLSALDAFLDMPLAAVVAKMRLAPELTEALLNHSGVIGEVLRAALAHERADWWEVEGSGFGARSMQDAYLDAVHWADGVVSLTC